MKTRPHLPALHGRRRAALWLGCAWLAAGSARTACAADLFDDRDFTALTADARARRAGDLLTILVMETSDASNTTDTSTDKSMSLNLGISGPQARFYGAGASLGDGFNGRGSVQRTGRLAAQITTSVQELAPNGDLIVQGEQEIEVHGEKTRIRLSGRLRRQDVSENNTALSSRLADARIEYVGDGLVSERARPGLISRIWTFLGL